MTNREAVKILGGDFSGITLKDGESHSDIFAEAFKMAIEALERQVAGDENDKQRIHDGTVER